MIDACHDPAVLERWCERAKVITTTAELFESRER